MTADNKAISALIACAFLVTSVSARDIFLCIGQSNMAGRAPIEQQDKPAVDNTVLLDGSGNWVPATNPLNRFASTGYELGPGYTFATTLAAKYPNKKFGLVVHAKGQTSIDQWSKTCESCLLPTAIRRMHQALSDPNNRFVGIIWHQGESDKDSYSTYISKMKAFVQTWRNEFNVPTLPFIVGQVEQWNDKFENINNVLLTVPDHIPYTDCVSSEGLTTTSDIPGPHFDSPSQRLLGQRYANAMIPLAYEASLISDAGASPALLTTAEPTTLSATVTASGATTFWSLLSGPSGVTIDKPHSLSTSASFTATGDYIFKFSASVTGESATENVAVQVIEPDNDAPTAPSSLKAQASSPTTVSLTWDQSSDNVGVEYYEVFREGEPVGTTLSAGFTDEDLVEQTTHSYTVRAWDASGNVSTVSAPETVTTPEKPSFDTRFEAERADTMNGFTYAEMGASGDSVVKLGGDNHWLQWTVTQDCNDVLVAYRSLSSTAGISIYHNDILVEEVSHGGTELATVIAPLSLSDGDILRIQRANDRVWVDYIELALGNEPPTESALAPRGISQSPTDIALISHRLDITGLGAGPWQLEAFDPSGKLLGHATGSGPAARLIVPPESKMMIVRLQQCGKTEVHKISVAGQSK